MHTTTQRCHAHIYSAVSCTLLLSGVMHTATQRCHAHNYSAVSCTQLLSGGMHTTTQRCRAHNYSAVSCSPRSLTQRYYSHRFPIKQDVRPTVSVTARAIKKKDRKRYLYLNHLGRYVHCTLYRYCI